MPMLTAVRHVLGALLVPVGALGAWAYYRGGRLDVRAALWIALGLTVGVFFGARARPGVRRPRTLRRGFSALLVVVAAKMWCRAARSTGLRIGNTQNARARMSTPATKDARLR